MSVAQLPKTVSVDDAVELIWERVLTGEFKDVAEATRSVWSSLEFSADDLSFLALFGFIQYTLTAQRTARRSSGGGRPGIGFGAPHGKKWDRYIALTWPYDNAAGQPTALLDFTEDDLAVLANRAGVLVDAYTRRRDWAVETSERLKEHKVSRVRDLPAFVLVEVDAAAREAMGRQE